MKLTNVVKETVSNTKKPFKDDCKEISQKIQCLDDDIILDIVKERINNKQCSTEEMTLDELKNRHPENYLDNKPSYGSEWDFLYW